MTQEKPTRLPRTRARGPGRPARPGGRRKPPADQRAALLDAAVLLFSRQGVNATSLQSVARAAGVTPALLHYYFGNREQLLDVIAHERLLPLVAGILQRVVGAGIDDPRALVRALVPVVMETVTEHRWLPPLWVREVLSEGGVLRERMLANARIVAPLVRDRLASAQARGLLNPQLDPRLLVVSIIGLTLFPFAAEPIWKQLFDARDITTGHMVRHTLALLENGIFAVGEATT